MRRWGGLLIVALAVSRAFGAAAPGVFSPRERYFNEDWTRVLGDDFITRAPSPSSISVETPAHPQPTKPFKTQYAAVIHMGITRLAFQMYSARYAGGELPLFIGESAGDGPASGDHDTVVAGSYEEDMPFETPFGDVMPFNRHFWDYKEGDYAGLATYDSSVNRAHRYWSGGYGMNGEYDLTWSFNPGILRGEEGMGVQALYQNGDKAKAYWYLGHIAHLLEDLTVPAHSHCWPHPFEDSDLYETYAGYHHSDYDVVPDGPIERFATLYELFRKTTEVAYHFDAGNGSGPLHGVDGDVDQGRRRAEGFPESALKEEASVLFPLATRRVAALFLYFYSQVDRTPPEVRLESPGSADPAEPATATPGPLVLAASAVDGQSGVDRESRRFEYQRWDGASWSTWQAVPAKPGFSAEFTLPSHGGVFAFRAVASDAVGNVGRSPVKYVRVD